MAEETSWAAGPALRWRGDVDNGALNRLHAQAFGTRLRDEDRDRQLRDHSLGWVTAHDADGRLVGFVNVAWDGGVHAFLIDTIVDAEVRRRGLGAAMVRLATAEARAAGCEWLHVDFEPHLRSFYLESCGFSPTPAGLIDLTEPDRRPIP